MISKSSNNVKHPVTKDFTPLYCTSHNYTSLFSTLVDTSLPLIKLHPTTLHYSLIWL